MVRAALGTLLGIVAGIVPIFLLEIVSGMIFPPPPHFDPSNAAQVADHMAHAPLAAMIAVIAGWALGSFVAGGVGAYVAKRGQLPGLIAGEVLLVGGVLTITELPHPTWMVIAGVLALTVPAFWGSRSFARA